MTGLWAAEAKTKPFIGGSANREQIYKVYDPSSNEVKGVWTHLGTQLGFVFGHKAFSQDVKIKPPRHNKVRTVSGKTISIHVHRMRSSIKANRLHCWTTTALEKDTTSYYFHCTLPMSGFHSSPITSSNDSNLSCCTCGSSKMADTCGRNRMVSQRYRVKGSRRHMVFASIQILPISVPFHLFLGAEAKTFGPSSFHWMSQLKFWP